MANPSTRQELVNYAKRQLGAPVLEINVADEQIEDLMDDAIQIYQNRHMDGVELMYLKHQVTQDFLDAIQAKALDKSTGITTTTASANITGIGVTTFSYEENQNFIQIPDAVIGIERVFKLDNRLISTNMFNINYQMALNDVYFFSSMELLGYTMTKRYLEDLDHILHPEKQIRFNRRQGRLYLDVDGNSMQAGDYLIIRCYRVLNPNDYTKVYNDPFLKKYFTALCKRQWGQNLIKFQGVKLPGGVELNGRQMYEDALGEIEKLEERMTYEYELPPLDLIG
jgi:hypothetical protein|tara:strand:- start:286 stop:1131 length:846 start_codon:yes stop_codon:yes gene_type:complete